MQEADRFYLPQLRGIQALAKGMHAVASSWRVFSIVGCKTHWDEISRYSPKELQDHFQGPHDTSSQDRKKIVNHFVFSQMYTDYDNKKIHRQMKWIQEWIEDGETTDLAVQKFLEYCTGHSKIARIDILPFLKEEDSCTYIVQGSTPSRIPTGSCCRLLLEFA